MAELQPSLVNLVSFYLPQFHEIPENDEWWGKGFTEWTNVRRAQSLFEGHESPRQPDPTIGYYDLSRPETAVTQASLAAAGGVEAFCYWHYWFGAGRRILEMPYDRMLASGSPNFPFCLCWANQTWTGVWHGAPNRVLIEQTYPGPDDFEAHFRAILPALRDPRYLTLDNKPIFLVYDPADLPDAREFVNQWRTLAVDNGLPGLFLIGMAADPRHPALDSFDAVMLNAPGDYLAHWPLNFKRRLIRRFAASNVGRVLPSNLRTFFGAPRVFNYADVVQTALSDLPLGPRYIPCVLPGWDNTPRSGRRGVVFSGSTPQLFAEYLKKAATRVRDQPRGRRLVFIKAWNEWAEGNIMEPDLVNGDAYLRATTTVLDELDTRDGEPRP